VSSMRVHQAAAARAAKDGDRETFRRERTEAKTEQLAAKIRQVADTEPRLTDAQRARLARTLLGSGDEQS
jgi:hypothetical protein